MNQSLTQGVGGSRGNTFVVCGLLLLGAPRVNDHAAPISTKAIRHAATAGRLVSKESTFVVANRDIYVVGADCGRRVRLVNTSKGADYFDPAFSRDGRQIAFSSNRDMAPTNERSRGLILDIYVVSSDGHKLRRITRGANACQPRFSPDNKRIVFTKIVSSGRMPTTQDFSIGIMNADGSGQKPVANVLGQFPVFTPDGSRIVFASPSEKLLGPLDYDISIMRVDGTGRKLLLKNSVAGIWAKFALSPDGQKIAFASAKGNTADIYVINLDGTGRTRLTDDHTENMWPAFNSDGTRIAYASRLGEAQISAMNLDGTRRVTFSCNNVGRGDFDWH